MHDKKWTRLKRHDDHYELDAEFINKTGSAQVNFAQIAFDFEDDRLAAVDASGDLYYVELSGEHPCYRKLGNAGQATFVAFNPVDKSELLIGLVSARIKVLKVDDDLSRFCLLIGHQIPPTFVSFYKNHALTSSRKEAIVWCLNSCTKAHQLQVNAKVATIRKASFSSLGHVVVLYANNAMQAWRFDSLEKDVKIDTKAFGVSDVRDFAFTRNGRAMILGGSRSRIVVLNTFDWSPIKTFSLPDTFTGTKRLTFVPSPLDGGANETVALITMSRRLELVNLRTQRFVDAPLISRLNGVRKLSVSWRGGYVACVDARGTLKLLRTERLLAEKDEKLVKLEKLEKLERSRRPRAHKVDEHLRCVRRSIGEELRLDRLLPILKEYGEYPREHRAVIWATILRLPSNKAAYIGLRDQASRESEEPELWKGCSLADRSRGSLLAVTLRCLARWCPLLAQSPFLADLVFPFLTVFQKNPLSAFEFVLTILTNYCQKWFEYHPLPPLNVLGIVENILMDADPDLLTVFCERGIASTDYAWPLLRTAMSEVLSAGEWLILWDHVISGGRTSLLLMCVVAFSVFSRETVISSRNVEDIRRFYTSQSHVRARDVLRIAKRLDHDVPPHLHPSRYIRDSFQPLPSEGSYPDFVGEFPEFLAENMNALQLERLKRKESTLRELNLRTVKLAEEKRVRSVTEEFVKQVHQDRMDEVRKCLEEQVRGAQNRLSEVVKETRRTRSKHPEAYNEINDAASRSNLERIEGHDRIERLQSDIDELDREVRGFLSSIRS